MLAGAPWQSDCREAEPWQSCWPGRCGGADGRECHGEEDCGTVAESHLEDAAGRGAAAKSYREDVAGRGAAAELLQAGNRRHRGLPAGTLRRRAIGKMLLAGAPQWHRYYWPGAPQRSCWPAAAGRHYDTKKRVTPKPSWTCGSPSCLLTTCYGCLRFAII